MSTESIRFRQIRLMLRPTLSVPLGHGTTAKPPAPLLITKLSTTSLVAFRTAKTVTGELTSASLYASVLSASANTYGLRT